MFRLTVKLIKLTSQELLRCLQILCTLSHSYPTQAFWKVNRHNKYRNAVKTGRNVPLFPVAGCNSVKITKLDHYFWNSIDAKTRISFLQNTANSLILPLLKITRNITTIVMCLHNTRIWELSVDERLKFFTFYLYSGIPLIRTLMGQNNLAVLPGQAQISWLGGRNAIRS